jgi:hypothetical protein
MEIPMYETISERSNFQFHVHIASHRISRYVYLRLRRARRHLTEQHGESPRLRATKSVRSLAMQTIGHKDF